MIRLSHENILVEEIIKDSKAGVLTVRQDESSAYMFFKVLEISYGAAYDLDLVEYDEEEQESKVKDISNYILITQRVAKLPFVGNKYFIDSKDVIAVIDKEYFEEL